MGYSDIKKIDNNNYSQNDNQSIVVIKYYAQIDMFIKKLYLWLKKLCQVKTYLFFVADTPTYG